MPLNPAGRKIADAWDLDADRTRGELCKAFGPPALIRQPGRMRIRWESDDTLLLEFDAGTQTRRFHFGSARAQAGRHRCRATRRPMVPAAAESRHFRPRRCASDWRVARGRDDESHAGYLRPNGVPYSERTVVKEFFDSFTLPEDGTWLIVTTVVADPDYLTQEFVLSSQFKKETDLSKWNPRPCDIPAPVVPARAPA